MPVHQQPDCAVALSSSVLSSALIKIRPSGATCIVLGWCLCLRQLPIKLAMPWPGLQMVLAREASLVDGTALAALEHDLEEPHACVDK